MVRQQQGRQALGSDALLTLVADDGEQLPGLFAMLWHEIQLFEHTFSRFIDDSELSYVNRRAGLPVEVTPEFSQLASRAKALSLDTNGLYNPFILPALQRVGYKGSWPTPAVHIQPQDYSQRQVADIAGLIITPGTVLLPPNTALDFGGIGKGYLLDLLAEHLHTAGCRGFCLSLGGDIVVQGTGGDGAAWRVGVAAAAKSGGEAAWFQNTSGKRMAVATSGVIKRKGAGWHHLIDPQTNLPSQTDILTATVCAASATEADVYAKCLVIAGSDKADAFMHEHKISRAVLQIHGKRGTLDIRKKEFKCS